MRAKTLRHIFFIDPLEKLVMQKDSTLLLAHTLREQGQEVSLLFEQDFHVFSDTAPHLRVFTFNSHLQQESFYLESFSIAQECDWSLNGDVLFHMRLDPPFDSRYLKYLWMMDSLKRFGVKFLNDPQGILLFNEKMTAFRTQCHLPAYVGNTWLELQKFAQNLADQGHCDLILKPLDLYQGIGVERVSLSDEVQLREVFERKVADFGGAVLAQPFVENIAQGEVRTVFWGEQCLGSILKVPPKGEYLANVAQGASYSMVELDREIHGECISLAQEIGHYGLHWLAYDVLDGHINEVNVTCPGLLVEVSTALKRNLALDLAAAMDRTFAL